MKYLLFDPPNQIHSVDIYYSVLYCKSGIETIRVTKSTLTNTFMHLAKSHKPLVLICSEHCEQEILNYFGV